MVSSEIELSFIPDKSVKAKAISLVRRVLPEQLQDVLRIVLRRQSIYLEPFEASILEYSAFFWIKNPSDRNVIVNPRYEELFSKLLVSKVVDAKGIFADIGSAQGYYSIIAAKTGAEVYAFDPDPISNSAIKDNLELNPEIDGKVHVIPEALGDQEGKITLNIDNRGRYAPSLRKTQPGLREKVVVPLSRFDFLVEQGRVPIPHVLKVDVEGAEGMVIRGMEETLSTPDKPRDLFIELHPEYLPLFGTDLNSVVKKVFRLGYRLAENPLQRGGELQCHFYT